MVNTRSSHPNGDSNTNDSYKDRHIKVRRRLEIFFTHSKWNYSLENCKL